MTSSLLIWLPVLLAALAGREVGRRLFGHDTQFATASRRRDAARYLDTIRIEMNDARRDAKQRVSS